MTTTAPSSWVMAAFALAAVCGPGAARADCAVDRPFAELAIADRSDVPLNAELRFVDPTSALRSAILSQGETAVDASIVFDELGTVLVPVEPLQPSDYSLNQDGLNLFFTVGEAEDLTPPAAPVVAVEYDAPPVVRLPLPPFWGDDCGPPRSPGPPHILQVEGDEGDMVVVDGVGVAVVRGGIASVRVPRRAREVQLRDLAGNTSEVTALDLQSEGGCSQAGSASSLAALLVLLGLLGARRPRNAETPT